MGVDRLRPKVRSVSRTLNIVRFLPGRLRTMATCQSFFNVACVISSSKPYTSCNSRKSLDKNVEECFHSSSVAHLHTENDMIKTSHVVGEAATLGPNQRFIS